MDISFSYDLLYVAWSENEYVKSLIFKPIWHWRDLNHRHEGDIYVRYSAPISRKFNFRFLFVNELNAFWKLSVRTFDSDCSRNLWNLRADETLNAPSVQRFQNLELSKL